MFTRYPINSRDKKYEVDAVPTIFRSWHVLSGSSRYLLCCLRKGFTLSLWLGLG